MQNIVLRKKLEMRRVTNYMKDIKEFKEEADELGTPLHFDGLIYRIFLNPRLTKGEGGDYHPLENFSMPP